MVATTTKATSNMVEDKRRGWLLAFGVGDKAIIRANSNARVGTLGYVAKVTPQGPMNLAIR